MRAITFVLLVLLAAVLLSCGMWTLDAEAQSVVVDLARIMQGEAEILGAEGARIVGHVALNRLAWYEDITTGWRGCLDGEPDRGYLWMARHVYREHQGNGYMYCFSASDREQLGLGESDWCYEREINGRTWGVYAYREWGAK